MGERKQKVSIPRRIPDSTLFMITTYAELGRQSTSSTSWHKKPDFLKNYMTTQCVYVITILTAKQWHVFVNLQIDFDGLSNEYC